MKIIKYILIVSVLAISVSMTAQCHKSNDKINNESKDKESKTLNLPENQLSFYSLMVYGNCESCQDRIEKTAMDLGAAKASWDKESQYLNLSYTKSKVSLEAIASKLSEVGHDNELYQATNQAYNALPKCCQYVRK